MSDILVRDDDQKFEIDVLSRKISKISEDKTIIQYDHNSERFTFSMPRYVEGHDMSSCTKIEVHYVNTDAEDKTKESTGAYRVEDVSIDEEDENKIVFSWLLSSNATKYKGTLAFNIHFACIDEDDIIIYAWHTRVSDNIEISKGMCYNQEVLNQNPDAVEQMRKAILELFKDKENNLFDDFLFYTLTKVDRFSGEEYVDNEGNVIVPMYYGLPQVKDITEPGIYKLKVNRTLNLFGKEDIEAGYDSAVLIVDNYRDVDEDGNECRAIRQALIYQNDIHSRTGQIIDGVATFSEWDHMLTKFDNGFGEDTYIGCNGYYIDAINTSEKWIVLSAQKTKPGFPEIGEGKNVRDNSTSFETGYAVGDVFSITNGAHYDFCGTIIGVYGTKIYYEGELPFNDVDKTTNDDDDHVFFVPSKPSCGTAKIVTISFATGIGTKAPGKCSFGAGKDVIAGGDYSFSAGRRTLAAYCAAALGLDTQAKGRYSFTVGRLSRAFGEYAVAINMSTYAKGESSFAHGIGTTARTRAMETGGMYNKTESDKIVVYGNGKDNEHRSDAYYLDWNGNGEYAGHLNSKLVKEDYFSNGYNETLYGYKNDFNDFIEPGFYNFVWNTWNNSESTAWKIMVSVERDAAGNITKVYQMREAFGPYSGKKYWLDCRTGERQSDGTFLWNNWVEIHKDIV